MLRHAASLGLSRWGSVGLSVRAWSGSQLIHSSTAKFAIPRSATPATRINLNAFGLRGFSSTSYKAADPKDAAPAGEEVEKKKKKKAFNWEGVPIVKEEVEEYVEEFIPLHKEIDRSKDTITKEWKLKTAIYIERFPQEPPLPQQWEIDYYLLQEEREKTYPIHRTKEEVAAEEKKYLQGTKANKNQKKDKKGPAAAEAPVAIEEDVERDLSALKDLSPEERAQIEAVINASQQEKKFIPKPQHPSEGLRGETDDDRANNRKSLDRALSKRLFLILQRPQAIPAWSGLSVDPQTGKPAASSEVLSSPWTFPALGDWQEGETLRQTAERVAYQDIARSLELYFLGNAPDAHIDYVYPPAMQAQTGLKGERIFVYRTLYTGGQLKLRKDSVKNFAWVTRDELKEYFHGQLLSFSNDVLWE